MAKPIKACTTKQKLKRPIKRVFRCIACLELKVVLSNAHDLHYHQNVIMFLSAEHRFWASSNPNDVSLAIRDRCSIDAIYTSSTSNYAADK
jgi:hypothetical protein